MARWQRVAPSRPMVRGGRFFTTIGSTILVIQTWTLLFRTPADERLDLLGVMAFMTLWTLWGWRMWRAGVSINDTGVRLCNLYRTRFVPWESVADFVARPATAGLVTVTGKAMGAQSIWVVLNNDELIQTALVYRPAPRPESVPAPPSNNPVRRAAKRFTESAMADRYPDRSVGLILPEKQGLAGLARLRQAMRDAHGGRFDLGG